MILIVDSRGSIWSLYDPASLKEVKTGRGIPRVLSKSVAKMGLIVSNLPSGEELAPYNDSLLSLTENEAKLGRQLRSKFKNAGFFLISDSAFFRSLPVSSFSYLTSASFKRTGLSGLTHQYLLNKASLIIGKSPSELNLITLHLDEFSTAAAIKDGIAIETTAGMSYLEGLPGARNSGSVDGDLIFKLIKEAGVKKAEQILKEKSGLLGYSGLRGNLEKVLSSPKLRTSPKFQLALKIYMHQIILCLGSYTGLLGKVDGVVFSGIIGEKSSYVREGLTQVSGNLRYSNILTIPAKPRELAAEILRRFP